MSRIAWVPYADADEACSILGEHEGVTYRSYTKVDEPPADPAEVNFLVMPYMSSPSLLDDPSRLSGLEVVQMQSAGYDNVPELPEGVLLCNGGGIHDSATAELAVALTLAHARHLDDFARNMTTGTWKGQWGTGLAYRRVTIVGYGKIGKAIERRIEGFDATSITRVARTPRTDPEVRPVSDLPQVLAETDVCIIILPLTDDTRGLFDAQMLAHLPDGALLVNVGRGPIVDTEALLAEVSSGRLHAALDVTDPEPLPADHGLWSQPNVLISPHVGGYTNAFEPRRDALLRSQVEAWAQGRPLDHVVRGGQP
ncbi:2-hydroxyacid dehydrogenase [Aestuariimicrobium ganziense]|uniref:2-hydroxyacid dehydrogenase n=1 Tax=Aestuariimicrobium ganziense TaxID=2773677 RepID=UPI0019446F83|nr:2-hydroxyacid dehydrogenase [Aestuariimicrobium ganziense]